MLSPSGRSNAATIFSGLPSLYNHDLPGVTAQDGECAKAEQQDTIDDAKAQIRDAQFDLEHCRITAPF
jgi:hypothetical protein